MDGLLNTLKFVYKISTDTVKTVVSMHNCILRCGGCMIIDFYISPYQEEISDVLLIWTPVLTNTKQHKAENSF
jgi:hypothetical protein